MHIAQYYYPFYDLEMCDRNVTPSWKGSISDLVLGSFFHVLSRPRLLSR